MMQRERRLCISKEANWRVALRRSENAAKGKSQYIVYYSYL